MPLSPSTSRRTLPYMRAIQIGAFMRNDGLWDVDAHIIDIKTSDFLSACRPLDDSLLRLTIDTRPKVVDVKPSSEATPYSSYGNMVGPASKKLAKRLGLRQNFPGSLKQRLTDIQGCAHLIDLIQVHPTATIQVFAKKVINEVINTRDDVARRNRSAQRDLCHAFDGAAGAQYYPGRAVKSPAVIEPN